MDKAVMKPNQLPLSASTHTKPYIINTNVTVKENQENVHRSATTLMMKSKIILMFGTS